jgi:CHAT domain-containing protein/tetratricopeptide (TPR) repeat protein
MKQSAFTRSEYRTLLLVVLMIFLVAPIAPAETDDRAFFTTNTRTLAAQTTAQESKPSDVRELKLGAPIERELAGGEAHSYRVSLRAGQYLQVLVDQKGIDAAVSLFAPDGKKLSEVDNNPSVGSESIFVVADATGDHRLELKSPNKDVKAGRYEIKIKELREATSEDRTQVAAEKVFEEANQLRDQQTVESRRTAIRKYEEVLPMWHSLNDRDREAASLNNIGLIHSRLGEPQKALEYYGQALQLYRASGNHQLEASTLSSMGTAHTRLGELQKALDYYNQALPLSRAVGDRQEEAATLNSIGSVYTRLGKPDQALEALNQSLSLRREVGDRRGEARTLHNIGAFYESMGELKKALEYYEQELPLFRLVGDRPAEGLILNNIGFTYSRLGELLKALEYYGQSLRLSRVAGERFTEAYTLDNMGGVYYQLSETQKALQSLNQALEIRRAIADRAGQATTLHNIGEVYSSLGEPHRALDYLDQSLSLKQEVGNRRGEAATLDSIGGVYFSLGESQKALDYHEKSLFLRRAVGDRYGEAYALTNIGVVYDHLGELKKALEYFDQSLRLRRTVGDRAGEASTLHNIGSTYSKLREADKALEYYTQALALARAVGYQGQEAATLRSIARAERDRGRLTEARAQIEAALKIVESTRSMLVGQELRTSFSASRQEFYDLYIDLLMRMHRQQPSAEYDAVALQASERARARTLVEILTEARADIRQGVDVVLLDRERSAQQQLNAKSERLTRLLSGKHTDEQETAARKEVEALLTDYQDVEAEIRAKSPRYAALTQPQPLSLREAQQLLDKETLLLEYALGQERSYLWAVTPTSIKSFVLPRRAEIETKARELYDALTARNKLVRFEKREDREARIAKADADYSSASAALSQILIGPIAGQLRRKRLLIVSDGALQYLPFGALPVSRGQLLAGKNDQDVRTSSYRPLITEHEIVSLPSASTLALLRKELVGRQRAAKTVAVLADPVFQDDDPRVRRDSAITGRQASELSSRSAETRGLESELERSASDTGEVEFRRLPFSRREAEGIAALTSNAMRKESLDFEANRVTATSADLSNYRIIHFATHGLLDSQHPELSGIVLSLVNEAGEPQDGFLRLNEIYNLRLGADLVVLSACRTALGKEVRGEGLVGLTRGFMYAGAPRVVASLWAVDDKITAELMKRFYREMLIKKQRPAAALRAAQVGIWKDKGLPPYYWAAFVLQGEWK